MSKLPRITVITPSLNQGRYLERAICSVLDQGYGNLEYIVIDGGSCDESTALIRHYDDGGITYWHSRKDRGPADAINEALAQATGDYVCVVPADGLLLPGVLHEAAPHLRGEEWYLGHSLNLGMNDEVGGRCSGEAPESLVSLLLEDAGRLPVDTSFFKRSLLTRCGGFDGSMRFAFGYELACRLLASDVRPAVLPLEFMACRERRRTPTITHLVEEGREYVSACELYLDALPDPAQRMAAWESCEQRRRIYALAENEASQSDGRRFLWQQLLRHPWWLASESYRTTLLRDASHWDETEPVFRRRAA